MTNPKKAGPKPSPKSGRKSSSKVRAKLRRRAVPPGPASSARILDLIGGMWAARAVGAFARLGIADQLAGGRARRVSSRRPWEPMKHLCFGCCGPLSPSA